LPEDISLKELSGSGRLPARCARHADEASLSAWASPRSREFGDPANGLVVALALAVRRSSWRPGGAPVISSRIVCPAFSWAPRSMPAMMVRRPKSCPGRSA